MITELLDSNLSHQAIHFRTLSQDKDPSGTNHLLIGLWVTWTDLMPVIFYEKYSWKSLFIPPCSDLA